MDRVSLSPFCSLERHSLQKIEQTKATRTVTTTPLNAYHMKEMEYKGKKKFFVVWMGRIEEALVAITVRLRNTHPSMDVGRVIRTC